MLLAHGSVRTQLNVVFLSSLSWTLFCQFCRCALGTWSWGVACPGVGEVSQGPLGGFSLSTCSVLTSQRPEAFP